MNADELIELWVERVQKGELVELPWRPLRSTVFRDGTNGDAWQAMVKAFASRGIGVTKRRRGHKDSSLLVVLSRLR